MIENIKFIEMVKSYHYWNKLPHFQPANGIFFVTIKLKGSIPAFKLKELSNLIESKNNHGKSNSNKLNAELYFSLYDDILDSSKYGPVYLKDEAIAGIVAGSIKYLQNNDYNLICYTIMPNHVHLIINKINRPLFTIMKSLKGYTGYEANRHLNRRGAFWQREYHDRVIRSQNELYNKIDYTLNNPVKAKLVKNWKEWKYTYLNKNYDGGSIFNRTFH